VTADGRVIGEHAGAIYYTLGQRAGLGVGGVRGAGEAPWYVAHKDLARNELVVVQGHDHPALMSHALEATALSWVAGAAPTPPLACAAKTRYRQPAQACTIEALADGTALVRFALPQRAITPGQSVVFYLGEVCLGGGVIARAA
jgi:tRNA-specific 2-thiouridylase